ncbi:secreted protein [Candidatus Magnetobacterium bavaricum]|uniref:Secreted protein n=1 Tax=Candidatus Magnetobacterium bavaricum TaxID=29290 RepID=A0A0F3GS77_9BACT|nr:secreted protein [Candidatus Magnetobacterium bavaricum]
MYLEPGAGAALSQTSLADPSPPGMGGKGKEHVLKSGAVFFNILTVDAETLIDRGSVIWII